MNRRKNKGNKRKVKGRYKLSNQSKYSSLQSSRLTWLDPHLYVTLRYSENFLLSPATSTAVSQIMNLNSLNKPNQTTNLGSGTSHQPMGYDTLGTIYNRYRVLKTKWKIVFSPSSLAYHLAVLPLNSNLTGGSPTTAAQYNQVVESPRAVFWTQGASGQSSQFVGKISLNEISGTTLTEYLADDRYEAAIGASPTEIMSLYIVLFNPNGSTINILFDLSMEFEVDFHDPNSQPQS